MALFLQDSSGMTLMDLITADPSTVSASASTTTSSSASTQPAQSSGYAASPPKSSSSSGLPTALGKPAGEKRSKRASLMQIQNDTISAAKAALNPVRTNINMNSIMPQKHKQKQKKVQTNPPPPLPLFLSFPFLFFYRSQIG